MTKLFLNLCLFIILSLLWGCDKNLSETYVFSISDTVALENQWELQLIDIPEDSRCPQIGACIWPGRIVAEFEMRHFDLKFPFSLSLGAKTVIPSDTLIGDYYFELLSVEPYPETEIITDKSLYRVKLHVEEVFD